LRNYLVLELLSELDTHNLLFNSIIAAVARYHGFDQDIPGNKLLILIYLWPHSHSLWFSAPCFEWIGVEICNR